MPLLGVAGCPSNTVARAEAYLCAKFHLDPSNHLVTIHPMLQTGQDKQTGQWSNSTGRTLLQTVPQKLQHNLTKQFEKYEK